MNAVAKVMIPNETVMSANHRRGPTIRTAMVAGSWNATDATVKTRIDIDCQNQPLTAKNLHVDVLT